LRKTELRADLAGRLSPSDRSDFLATLLRVARADDISAAERNRLQPVAEWLQASPEELTRAMLRADDQEILLAELVRPFDELVDRFLLFRECCAVVWVDGHCSQEEEKLLDRLSILLDIDNDARDVMDTPLACSPEGERRFLELLALTHEATHLMQVDGFPAAPLGGTGGS
jgi:uncharacterized tellurite resistance protein B-like protein